ncbi:hypothetical protein H9Y04_16020 [Streptomyces sp. TRM66268-LWL]|uniref:Uncharacterized protein n=1 Tax=Streptomyces polyasparticus TaxID=2767826 RepID=A0ABR7SHX4_9ACTN|nr:hypothetical protein [Streptomyces polyasparticus]MBC9714071.1 hypothetical protein [Streptomyces polyasparticus]
MSTPTPTAPATTSDAPAAPPAASTTTAAEPAATAPTNPPSTEAQDVASLPAWAQKLITDTRAEAANYRTRAQAAEQTPAQATAPTPAPTVEAREGDVSRLPQWAQRALSDGQTAAHRAAVQAAVIQAAPGAGADVARLLDSQSFAAAVAEVDPADPAAITQAITNALTAQPWLAATPSGPARAGADFTNTGPGEVTAEQFARMSYAERVELHQTAPETYRRLAG